MSNCNQDPDTFIDAVARLVDAPALEDALCRLARCVRGAASFDAARERARTWKGRNSPSGSVALEVFSFALRSKPAHEVADALEHRYTWLSHCERMAQEGRRGAESFTLRIREPYAMEALIAVMTRSGRGRA